MLGILHADNAAGQVAAKMGMEHASKPPSKKALRWSVSAGWVTRRNLLFCAAGSPRRINWHFACQSDPMVVPFGGAEIYYGTTHWPLPRREKAMRSLPSIWRYRTGMGKSARRPLAQYVYPGTWAVDKNGAPTTDPFAVHARSPPLGRKGMA